MLCLCGRIALYSFISSLTSLLIILILNSIPIYGNYIISDWFHVIFVTHAVINHIFLAFVYYSRGRLYIHVNIIHILIQLIDSLIAIKICSYI
jgi:hypothetical protein